MIGEQLGDFTIEAELGSGGMGRVYRAAGPDGVVALKVIHPHLLEEKGFFKRFLREADIGKKVAHGNVVRTLDVDALGGHHFLVMEYVQGKSLRELLDDLGTVPETLLREIALQTAAGLAAIHAAGIVHRDLKPENVLITDDHEIRIMDLGVAKLQEASIAITREGQFAGSLLYAAPEQFRRDDEVGPASDLYSLGVLLYELATGQNPFRSDDASAVISAHLTELPPRAHERGEDLSLFFSEVVATLLAKQPADRFASSEELQTVLEEAERSAWWIERAPVLQEQVARLPKIRVSRETRLHGRDDDLALLRSLFERASAGSGNTVFLEGEAGIGKTRLIDEFLCGLGEEDLHVLYGSYPPSGGLGGLSEAVLGKFGEVRLADALAPYLTVTPSLVPAFAALVKHESPPTGAGVLQGDALQATVVHLMRALAAEKPTVWIVDDLQFAPQESHDLLLAMARAVEDHRVLLVATARAGLDLADLSRLENFQRIELARLGGREIIELLEDAFRSEDLAEKLGVKITKKSDGVPFFIFEMIRGLKEGQFIKQLPDGSYVQTQVIDEIEVPSAVKDLIDGRMRGLSESQRAVLDAGAVNGMTFDPGLVAHVLEERRVRVLRDLAEIERRFGLVRDEGEAVRFDQNQIQETLYQGLTPHLRAEYHTLLAEAYLNRCGDEAKGDDAVFLVHHHLHGSRPKGALPHLEPAFDHLEKSYRNDTLVDLAKRALELGDLLGEKERVEVLLRMALRLDALSRHEEQRAAVDEALALVEGIDDVALRSRAQRALGGVLRAASQLDAAQAAFREAEELARTAGDRQGEAYAIANLGFVSKSLGRFAEAQEQLERGLVISREIGDRLGEASLIGALGGLYAPLGRLTEAQEYLEESIAISREIGDRGKEAGYTSSLGTVLTHLGRHAEAREHLERSQAISREIGERSHEAGAAGSLGLFCFFLGRCAETKEHLERCRALSREVGNLQTEAIAHGNLGDLFATLGRPAEAREHCERALALVREIGFRPLEGYLLYFLGTHADDAEEGIGLCREALALFREMGMKHNMAETLIALGRLEAAPARLDEALALARETGEPGTILAATVERARLPDGDVQAALAALAENEERVGHGAKMNARFRLWELTQDRAHLEEAHRLLEHLRDHAPEEDRDSLIENVRLHREIMKAWAEHGSE